MRLNIKNLEDFGFENIIWIFSGRRGVHCWVSDFRARTLSVAARKAIVSFLEISRINVLYNNSKSISFGNRLYPSIELVEYNFIKYINIFLEDLLTL